MTDPLTLTMDKRALVLWDAVNTAQTPPNKFSKKARSFPGPRRPVAALLAVGPPRPVPSFASAAWRGSGPPLFQQYSGDKSGSVTRWRADGAKAWDCVVGGRTARASARRLHANDARTVVAGEFHA